MCLHIPPLAAPTDGKHCPPDLTSTPPLAVVEPTSISGPTSGQCSHPWTLPYSRSGKSCPKTPVERNKDTLGPAVVVMKHVYWRVVAPQSPAQGGGSSQLLAYSLIGHTRTGEDLKEATRTEKVSATPPDGGPEVIVGCRGSKVSHHCYSWVDVRQVHCLLGLRCPVSYRSRCRENADQEQA